MVMEKNKIKMSKRLTDPSPKKIYRWQKTNKKT